jgi:hypothetical protein
MQQITDWDDAQIEQTRQAIKEYKGLRGLIRDAKIIHLQPPRHNVNRVGWGWDAIQAVSADRSESVIMVYRALGGPTSWTVHPRGLDAEAAYRVHLTDRGDTLSMTGAALARDGVELALDELSSEVLRVSQ